jgi:hypothetical protein
MKKAFRINIRSPKFDVQIFGKDKNTNFSSLRRGLPFVVDILDRAETLGIKEVWYFWEPHLEITWVSEKEENSQAFIAYVKFLVQNLDYFKDSQIEIIEDKTGKIVDWYCGNKGERKFGIIRHSLASQLVKGYVYYQHSVDFGKGLNRQVGRMIHCICNPLGLNYVEEAKICFSRGLICLLFRFLGHKKAVWVFEKVFRLKY